MRTRCKYAHGAAVSYLPLVSENEGAMKGKQTMQLGEWLVWGGMRYMEQEPQHGALDTPSTSPRSKSDSEPQQ